MKNLKVLCVPNHVTDTGTTIAASSSASADAAVANLRDVAIGRRWRSAYASPSSATLTIGPFAGYREIGAVCLGNTNLKTATLNNDTGAFTATARYPIRASDVSFTPRMRPDALLAATSGNLSGTVAAIQDVDPEHPDATWITCTNNLANTLAASFADPSAGLNLSPTLGAQKFRVTVRRKAAGGTDPTIQIDVYESGVFKATTTTGQAVTSTTGQVIEGVWTGGVLTATSGTNLEIRVTATAGSTTTVEYGCVEAVFEFATNGGSWIDDTGQLTPSLPAVLGQSPLNLYHVYATAILPVCVFIDLIDSTNTDGYLEAGYLMVGPAHSAEINVDYGCEWRWVDPSILTKTPGGRVFAELRTKYRVFDGQFQHLRKAEGYGLFNKVDRRIGITDLCGLMFDADDTTEYHNTAAIGRLIELTGVPLVRFQRYTKRIYFEEAVA